MPHLVVGGKQTSVQPPTMPVLMDIVVVSCVVVCLESVRSQNSLSEYFLLSPSISVVSYIPITLQRNQIVNLGTTLGIS